MKSLTVRERQAGHVMVLELEGELTFGWGRETLRAALARQLTAGRKNVLLDFAGLCHLDSAGLGELINSYVLFRRASGQLKLVRVAETAHELMTLTKIVTLFEPYEDEVTALEAFTLGADYRLVPA